MSEKSLLRIVFPQAVIESVGYYVYRLLDPRNGQTFYVGKGSGNRVFQHIAEATSLPDRVSLKIDRIRDIESSGNVVRYVLHRHGLTESEALLVESVLIDAYEELLNAQLGHGTLAKGMMNAEDVIALYDRGAAEIDVAAVLVNLRRQYERDLSADELYERTRGYWAANPNRHPQVRYGMAVAFGIIREVYTINAWVRYDVEDIVESELRRVDVTPSKSKVRYAFTGTVATDIRDRFVGKSVQWPSRGSFLWKNC